MRPGDHQVSAIEVDPTTGRIAACMRDGIVSVWTLDSGEKLQSVLAVQIEKITPVAISILDNTLRDMVVFTMSGQR